MIKSHESFRRLYVPTEGLPRSYSYVWFVAHQEQQSVHDRSLDGLRLGRWFAKLNLARQFHHSCLWL
ncbi:MAG TPA: hypothetical protein V6D18_20325 [Thermosynechococcaceae cyanobacterium]